MQGNLVGESLAPWSGYKGHRAVEIFSERNWWRRDPDEVCRVIKERYQATV